MNYRRAWRNFLWPENDGDRLSWAMGVAVVIHAAVVFGVHFSAPEPSAAARSLDVTLAQYEEERPETADFLAQSNQIGSGDSDEVKSQRTPYEAEMAADVEQAVAFETPALAALTPATPQLSTMHPDTTAALGDPPPPEQTDPQEQDRPDLQQRQYLDVAAQVATLQARLESESQHTARKPRIRRITSVSTHAAAEAYYLNAWRRHIETVGKVNYPADERNNKIYGSLRLLVAIGADGNLNEVRILESSGKPQLDQAAMRIVRLAAPFAPFPEDMRKESDILEIIRTWQFRKTHGSEFSG